MIRTDVTALILAGGRATRFGGVDKRALVVDGETIFERQVRVLESRVATVIVSAPADVAGYDTVRDVGYATGPLAGVAAGLTAASSEWVLVVAGDMPYLSGAVVDLLLGATFANVDAAAIKIGELPQPLLCALRVATALPVLELRLAAGRLKASGLLTDEGLRVAWISEAALRAVDPDLKALVNVNAPGDLPG